MTPCHNPPASRYFIDKWNVLHQSYEYLKGESDIGEGFQGIFLQYLQHLYNPDICRIILTSKYSNQ